MRLGSLLQICNKQQQQQDCISTPTITGP